MNYQEIEEIVSLFNKRDAYLKKLNHCLILLKKTSDLSEKSLILKKAYLIAIKASKDFYRDKYTIAFYEDVKNKVLECEREASGFILSNFPKYREVPLYSHATSEEILDHLLSKVWNSFLSNKSLKSVSFVDRCLNVSFTIEMLCDNLDIECERLLILAGFDERVELYNGRKFHYFNIITLNNEKYLVDASFRQFFTLDNNVLEKIGVYMLPGCYNGVFMKMDETRLRVARELLTKGYIKIDDDVLKAYMDGFALSFRNGLYYEETNDYSFTTPYTVDDYMRFMEGEDSQVKHEGTEVLGFQIRPVKKTLNFSK